MCLPIFWLFLFSWSPARIIVFSHFCLFRSSFHVTQSHRSGQEEQRNTANTVLKFQTKSEVRKQQPQPPPPPVTTTSQSLCDFSLFSHCRSCSWILCDCCYLFSCWYLSSSVNMSFVFPSPLSVAGKCVENVSLEMEFFNVHTNTIANWKVCLLRHFLFISKPSTAPHVTAHVTSHHSTTTATITTTTTTTHQGSVNQASNIHPTTGLKSCSPPSGWPPTQSS